MNDVAEQTALSASGDMYDDSDYNDTPEGHDGYVMPRRHWSADIHRSSEYQALRKQFRRECALARNDDGTYGLPCWRCHGRIDYRLRWPHPHSFSLDHQLPVRSHPELALVPSNFRPAHLKCNQSEYRDDDLSDLDLGEPSEIW
jgi:hypothetical protein